jgi:hypothetical protein
VRYLQRILRFSKRDAELAKDRSKDDMSNKWQGFLDSLATTGGNILILVLFAFILLVGSVYVMIKFGPSIPTVAFVTGSYGQFQGALLMALVGKNRNGNGATVANNAAPTS